MERRCIDSRMFVKEYMDIFGDTFRMRVGGLVVKLAVARKYEAVHPELG